MILTTTDVLLIGTLTNRTHTTNIYGTQNIHKS